MWISLILEVQEKANVFEDRNENFSTASKLHDADRKSKIEDCVKNENYSEKVSKNGKKIIIGF